LAALVVGAMIPGRALVIGASAAVRSCPPANSFYSAVHKAPRKDPFAMVVDPQAKLSSTGEVIGRTLQLNAGGSLLRQFDLAPESFAAQPVANVVVFGQYDATRGSTVRAADLESGCEFALFSTPDAVRSAVIDTALASLYVHAVAAGDRSDRGVRRIDLATGASRLAVPPVAASDTFGATFATLLRWSLAGDDLAIQSCGFEACRTRVLNPTAGTLQAADRPHGQLIGLTKDLLVAFDTCPDLPCALESVDRASGAISSLGIEAFSADLELVGGSPLLVADTPAGAKEIRP
jgi:hypothetical protein